jgi:hypothetical protein
MGNAACNECRRGFPFSVSRDWGETLVSFTRLIGE